VNRRRYTPRLSLMPLRFVRWRTHTEYGAPAAARWRVYLFGVLPIASLPRKSAEVSR